MAGGYQWQPDELLLYDASSDPPLLGQKEGGHRERIIDLRPRRYRSECSVQYSEGRHYRVDEVRGDRIRKVWHSVQLCLPRNCRYRHDEGLSRPAATVRTPSVRYSAAAHQPARRDR